MSEFTGRTVMITGSGTGIGKAIATKFAQNGASIIILGRRKAPLDSAAAELENIISKAGGAGTVRVFDGVDVSDEAAVSDMFDALERDGTKLDILVNNAGVSGPVMCFTSAPRDEFESAVNIHLTGTFWVSHEALRIMKKGSKIITISTFFTEERPLEQRPYRFRTPYTAAQGAKNRLAESFSWELAERGIISIATNPGPVHSDRIYKTVYPKAALEFMRVGGFENLEPSQIRDVSQDLLDVLGEDEATVEGGISRAAKRLAADGADTKPLEGMLRGLLCKIQDVAEKIQRNTSGMIADSQFLSQEQVAHTVLRLSEDGLARILNGKVIPGDRVFYPVRPHIGAGVPAAPSLDLSGRCVVITAEPSTEADVQRITDIAGHVEKCGGRAVCLVSSGSPAEFTDAISKGYHTHAIDVNDSNVLDGLLRTASEKAGSIAAVVHVTRSVPQEISLGGLDRASWDALVSRFITTPAAVARSALKHYVPGGDSDPRLYRDSKGTVVIIGPDLPEGRKVSGTARSYVEIFRGALRPFATTANQELSDVLKSQIRMFAILPGSVDGKKPDPGRINAALDFAVSESARDSAQVVFCPDESR